MKTGALAIDAMGGDLGPSEVVEGIALAYEANQIPEKLIVVGREEILTPLLKAKGLIGNGVCSTRVPIPTPSPSNLSTMLFLDPGI
jgi:hypothetical protein